MRNSIIIILFFAAGIVVGMFPFLPECMLSHNLSLYALYLLMFLVGVGIGGDMAAWNTIRSEKIKIVLVPLSVILGTFLGVGIASLFLKSISFRESLAVGAGFGYYSLSSIVITQIHGETLGIIALLSNIFREITTLLLTPFFARYCGTLAPIASAGATAMDTTLPIIARFVGKEYAIVSVFSGVVLTFLVPFLIVFILQT